MTDNKTKKCSGTCKKVLPLEAFGPNAHKADGLQSECRDCRKALNTKWRDANPGYWSEWYAANKDKRAEYQAAYVAERIAEDLEGHRAYARAHQAVRRAHGSASGYLCACGCGKQAYDCALMADAAELKKSKRYTWSDSVDDYVPMARSCHRKYDTGNLVVVRKAA